MPSKHDSIPSLRLRNYNCEDVIITGMLAERYTERLAEAHNGPRLAALLHTLQDIADKMTWHGLLVDRVEQIRQRDLLEGRVGKARTELLRIATACGYTELDPGSNISLRQFFFNHLGAPQSKWSETTQEPSLDEDACARIVTGDNAVASLAARQLLQMRKWGTLLNTHVYGLRLDPRGVAHPFWRPGGAKSGRWSSSGPNIMNVPNPVEEALLDEAGQPLTNPDGTARRMVTHPGLRRMYVPRPGNYIVQADYKQIELRIVVYLANDEPLLKAFRDGDDPHATNAWMMFHKGVAPPRPLLRKHVTKREATLAKNFAYLVAYGGDAQKLWETVLPIFPAFTIGEANTVVRLFKESHPRVVAWQKQIERDIKRDYYVDEPVSGRRQYFWGPEPYLPPALNFKVQPLASEIINRAIQGVDRRVKWDDGEAILMQCHDALVLEGPDPQRLAAILQEEMEGIQVEIGGHLVSFPVDLSAGKRWSDLEDVSL